jgi:hypothetical protein
MGVSMLREFNYKLALIVKKMMTAKVILLTLLSVQSIMVMADPPKAVWYRYYDSKGIANVSSTVTPDHIRYGYEALDTNMQVIQRARPYNAKKDAQYAPQGAIAAKQRDADLKLKRAYTNSQVATEKRNTALSYILKQIKFQQDELKQLQNDRIGFLLQEKENMRKGKSNPKPLQDMLDYNSKNIVMKKEQIQSLQSNYRSTKAEYDRIIARLKTFE